MMLLAAWKIQNFFKFDGVLSNITLVEGGIVTANERIGRLIDPNSLEVAFEFQLSNIRLLNENGQLINARVLYP